MSQSQRQPVGRLKTIYRHPVKSMRGEALQEAEVAWHGLVGDRRFSFVRSGNFAGFPWLTGRVLPEMVSYTARYDRPNDPYHSPVTVTTPDGRTLPVDSPDLLAELADKHGAPAHLTAIARGCYDAMPLSLLGIDSVEALSVETGFTLNPRRFRPNLLIELASGVAFGEERWLDLVLLIGEGETPVRIHIHRQNVRCAMTNIDPDTGERDPRVLKTITEVRDECMGVYATVEQPGQICQGDPIYLVGG